MFAFASVPVQTFVRPGSFTGIYSEDQYLNDLAQHAAHNYASAHARVRAIERQREHQYYDPRHYHHHHHGSNRLHHNHFARAPSCHAFGGSPFGLDRRASVHSLEELAYSVWQEEERQRALVREREAIARQREVVLAREREAQRQRAIAEAAAREQHAREVRAARAQARRTHDQELLLALLGQLGLAFIPGEFGHAAPRVNREQPAIPVTHPAAAPSAAPIPEHVVDRKGKGKAVDIPVEEPAPVSMPTPAPIKVPTLKEELQARIHSEADPDVQESLVLLYSDLFDVREPAQPVAGPSGHKGDSFKIPVSGPSPAPVSPVMMNAEEAASTSAPTTDPEAEKKETDVEGAHLHRTSALPPTVAAKLIKFYRARRARKLSLAEIKQVEDALRELEGAFEFPEHLDFTESLPSPPSPVVSDTDSALAFTPNNTPIHAYENALNNLLTRLDAVESHGDLEVRGRRKEVVKEVERALEVMERWIEESKERSRERSRRGSVSSDASVTVTPYDVRVADNVDEVEVAVEEAPVPVEEAEAKTEEVLVEVENAEAAVEFEEIAAVPSEEGPVKVDTPAEAAKEPEATPAPLTIDTTVAEPQHLAVGLPDSGADPSMPLSPDDIHGDPSSPLDDFEDVDHAFDVFSPPGEGSGPEPAPSAAEEATVPSRGSDIYDIEKDDVNAATSEAQGEAIATEPKIETQLVGDTTEPTNAAPETTLRIQSTATETTFATAEADSVPPTSAADDATFFVGGTMTLSELEPTHTSMPAPAPASPPVTHTESVSSDAGEETFLLSSTPLADEQPKRRKPSSGEDELEIISKDELEVARNDSDWSDFETESDL